MYVIVNIYELENVFNYELIWFYYIRKKIKQKLSKLFVIINVSKVRFTIKSGCSVKCVKKSVFVNLAYNFEVVIEINLLDILECLIWKWI